MCWLLNNIQISSCRSPRRSTSWSTTSTAGSHSWSSSLASSGEGFSKSEEKHPYFPQDKKSLWKLSTKRGFTSNFCGNMRKNRKSFERYFVNPHSKSSSTYSVLIWIQIKKVDFPHMINECFFLEISARSTPASPSGWTRGCRRRRTSSRPSGRTRSTGELAKRKKWQSYEKSPPKIKKWVSLNIFSYFVGKLRIWCRNRICATLRSIRKRQAVWRLIFLSLCRRWENAIRIFGFGRKNKHLTEENCFFFVCSFPIRFLTTTRHTCWQVCR